MAEEEKKTPSVKRISDQERFKYVGFDVFPGRIKDLFKSEAEKDQLVDKIRKKRANRASLGALREECTLLEARVSLSDRIMLTVACLFMIAALFFPWYSAYNEIVEEPVAEVGAMVADSAAVDDSLQVDTLPVDSTAMAATDTAAGGTGDGYAAAPKEELLHGYVARKKVRKEYTRLTGIGSLAALGSAGSHVFSSGLVLVVTGILFLVMTLSCLALPGYTLFGLFGLKGNADEKALKLKSILRWNWVPLCLFVFCLAISFVGANYGAGTSSLYTSFGDSYGVGAFLGSLSWGAFITLGASIMLAVKSIEI